MTTTPTNALTDAAAAAADAEVKPAKPAGQDLRDDRQHRRSRAEDRARTVRARAGRVGRAEPEGGRPVRGPGQVHRHAHLPGPLPGTVLPGRHGRAAAARRGRRDGRDRADPVRVHLLGVRRPPRLRLPVPGHRRTQPERQRGRRPARPDHRVRTQPPGHRGHRDLPRHAEPDHRRPLRLRRHRTGRPAARRRRRPVLPAAAPRERAHRAGRVRLHLRTGQGQGAARRQRRRASSPAA